jgi:hypothetical protein
MQRCLTPQELVAFAAGRLTPAARDASQRHAADCATCRHLLATATTDAAADAGEWVPFHGTERFTVMRCLGVGGMGVVYEAEDRQQGRRVALKTLRHFSGPMLVRLKHEFRALAGLHHRNLVSRGELVEDGGQWFFTMELVDGCDFLSHVRPDERLDEGRLRAALGEIADGLDALHGAGRVHRDVKPSNVLVEPSGRVVLLDFGLVWGTGHGFDPTGGTPEYMAPEQARAVEVGPAADWYGVGVMMYQALCGQLPIDGSRESLLKHKLLFEPVPPSANALRVPEELDLLCSELLRIDPRRRPSSLEIRRKLGRALPSRPIQLAPPFVGREVELAQLSQALEAVHSGPIAMLVAGESGLGKSALVRRFCDEAAAAGAMVLRGRCYERESVPYKGVDEIVDALSERLGAMPPHELLPLLPRDMLVLAQAFPVLARLRALAGLDEAEAPRDPVERRLRLGAGLRTLVSNFAARAGRLVLAVDDLQWSDSDSLTLLREIMRVPSLLLVATLRPGIAAPLDCEVRHLSLGPLASDDARALARQLAVAEADAAAVAAEAAGHPLFIFELARHARHAERGALTLDEALRGRVRALDGPARLIVELVALSGTPVAAELLTEAAQLPGETIAQGLLQLGAEHLVRSDGEQHEPYHERVRVAVSHELDEAARRERHRRLATALEASGRRDPEPLLLHWRGAGEKVRAAGHAVAAAEQAAEALAFVRAAELYRVALTLDPARADAATLLVRRADALANAGRQLDAAAAYREAEGAHTGLAARDLLRRAAEQLLQGGRTDEGLALLDRVLADLGLRRVRSPGWGLMTMLGLRARLWLRGLVPRAHDPARITPDALSRLETLHATSDGLFATDLVGALAFHTRYLLAALDCAEPRQLMRAFAGELAWATLANRPQRRHYEELAARARALATRLDEPAAEARLVGTRGVAAVLEGRWQDGVRELTVAEALMRDRCVGMVHELNVNKLFQLIALHFRGELLTARARREAWLHEALDRGELFGAVAWRIGLATGVLLGSGDRDGARKEVQRAEALAQSWPSPYATSNLLIAHATLDLYGDDRAAAWRRLRSSWGGLGRAGAFQQQWLRVFLWDLRGRAVLAAATVATGAARRKLVDEAERAARAIVRVNAAWAAPLSTLLDAGIAELAHDTPGARRQYAAAARAAVARGMMMHAAVARSRASDGDDDGSDWLAGNAVADRPRLVRLYAPVTPT